MKTSKFKLAGSVLLTLAALALTASAQTGPTNYGTITFDTTNDIAGWGNWFGGAFTSLAWATNDQPVNTLTTNTGPGTSGSVQINSLWNGTADQIMIWTVNGYSPALDGSHITNFECDVMFDPGSCTNPAGNFGGLHFGSRGTGFGQPMFGATSIPYSQAGTWVHINFPVSSTAQSAWTSIPDVLIQLESYGGTRTGTSTFYVDNIKFGGYLTLPPPPPPTLSVVKATPGLRIFAQDSSQTYNQEGFGTVDSGQTWLYGDSFFAPVSYSITFADFDTVNNYTFYAQFVPNSGNSGNPYIVFQNANALTWSITHQSTGFTTSIDWKTNNPNGGNISNALAMITHSTNGRGTWTITFTSDTQGSVTSPDGTNKSFSLPPEVSALFASSGAMTILFGTAPNNAAGFGQYIDIKSILITNVPGINESDDFTKDSALNTAWWNPGFSFNAGSVFLVSTNSAYWVNWTVPDPGFGLETKASLDGGTNVWFSPGYYGSGVGVSNTVPTQMGLSQKWTLIPTACLPTVDGTTNGPVSPTAFFRLSNPAPSQ